MSAIAYWRNRVGQHHVQSIKAQEGLGEPGDMWRPLAQRFKDDPHRTGDSLLNGMLQWAAPDRTVLDVGGGAGRYALPLALRSRQVTVVEPSESMAAALLESAGEAGIGNVTVVPENWEQAEVEAADLVICAHVVYGVTELEPFIRKLESHARQRVVLAAFVESPLVQTAPVWARVHGEERILLPALPELVRALWEMDIYPDIVMMPPEPPQSVPDRAAAETMLRRWLYVAPDTEEDGRLQTALDELLIETPQGLPQGLMVKDSRPQRQGLISWQPG